MIDITYNIEKYVIDKNRVLWETLSSKHTIKLFYDKNDYSWSVRKGELGFDIICPNLEVNYASFTHELLHIYIEDLGMTSYDSFYNTYQYDSVFGNKLFLKLFGWIYNFSCHKKMFPYFEKLGFSEYDFVQDRINYGRIQHFQIFILMKIRKLKVLGVEQFLGNFFSLKNNVVNADNSKCFKFLNKLRKINPELYDIADEFDEKWEKSEDLNLLEPFDKFKMDLKDWFVENYSRR